MGAKGDHPPPEGEQVTLSKLLPESWVSRFRNCNRTYTAYEASKFSLYYFS